MSVTRRRAGWLLFLTLLASFGYVNQYPGWNQNSRLDLLHALFSEGTLTIDRYRANTGDLALIGGHYYSEKAPGGAVLALPAFGLAALGLRIAGIDLDSPQGWSVSGWVATAGSVGLLTALAGVCFFSFLAHRTGERTAALATLAVFLGAMPFPYATALFSHGAVMALLFIALWAFDRAEREGGSRFDALVGLCCGLAAASEYPAALACGAVFLAMLSLGPGRAVRFAASAVLPVLLVPAYHWLVSGSVLTVPYLHSTGFPALSTGLVGAKLPRPSVGVELLFGEYRGLFVWSPVLLFCFLGLRPLHRQSVRLFWLAVSVPVVMFAYVSSYHYWDGGWALGPRLASAAVPFLAVAAGLGLATRPVAGAAVGVASLLLVSLATLVNGMPPEGVTTPLREYYPQRLLAGDLARNLGTVAGLRGWWSLVPFFGVLLVGVIALWTITRRAPVLPDA